MSPIRTLRWPSIAALVAMLAHVLAMAHPGPAESAEDALARALQLICTIEGRAALDDAAATPAPAHAGDFCDHCTLCGGLRAPSPERPLVAAPDPAAVPRTRPVAADTAPGATVDHRPPGRAPPITPNA